MGNSFISSQDERKIFSKKHKKILTIFILNAKIQSISLILFIIMNDIQECMSFTFANGGNGMKMDG